MKLIILPKSNEACSFNAVNLKIKIPIVKVMQTPKKYK